MRLIKKFQMGGPAGDPNAAAMPAQEAPMEGGAPVEGGQDPLASVISLFVDGLQTQNCEMLAQGAQMFLQLVQEAQGGAGAPAEGQPVFAKGGKLVGRTPVQLQLVRK